MAKPSSSIPFQQQTPTLSSSETISKNLSPKSVSAVVNFFGSVGISDPAINNFNSTDFYSDLICGHIKVQIIEPGHISCIVSIKPALANYFGGAHGGAVGAIAERLAIATARTVVGEDKELFVGELGISYLSAAPKNAELIMDGSVVRSGRNLTVTAMAFKMKNSGKLVYTARATLFNSPISKL